jgi:iron complex transport system substrate-binding protein
MRRFVLVILVIFSLAASGCLCVVAPPAGIPTPAPAAFPLTVTDDLGRAVTLEKEPLRLVSLAPSNTEILFALGLGDRVLGVTTYCNYPEEAKSVPKVGGFSSADLEKIVALAPDLVMAARVHQKEVVPALEKLGIKVMALAPTNLEGMFNSLRLTGRACGREGTAGKLIMELETRVRRISDRTGRLEAAQRPGVLYLNWVDPFKTAGKGTFVDDLLTMAGGRNVAGGTTGYNAVNLESILAFDPAVILVSGMGTARRQMYLAVLADKRLAVTSACRNERVHEIDSDLVDRPGPRLAKGLDELFRYIQPGLYPIG